LDAYENIKLIQTNTTYPSVTRLEADSLGDFYLNFEDGNNFMVSDTSHNVQFEDHNGTERLSLFDVSSYNGANVMRSALNQPSFSIGGLAGSINTFAPITFYNDPVTGSGSPSWPATVMGTTTNFITAAQNSGTSATTVNLINVPANTMTNNGDTLTRTIGAQLASGTSSKDTQVYFAGTLIFDTGAIANTTAGNVSIHCEVTRINSSTVSYSCEGVENDATGTPKAFAKVGTIGGLSFTGTLTFYEILTASGTGAASSQDNIILDNVVLKPSANWQGLQ
jgi:hypothetical protein